MTLGLIVLAVLALILIGAVPRWPHSAGWGYYPTAIVGGFLLIIVILVLTGLI